MAHPSVVLCLTCHTPLQSDDPAVFREGVKIAHVRCWRLKHASPPQSEQPDVDGHRPASTDSGLS
jgi:hypothetical protein